MEALTYPVRVIGVFATRWRYAGGSNGPRLGADQLGEGLADYYRRVEDEEPYELPDVLSRTVGTLSIDSPDPDRPADRTAAEVLVFALPFPADQVVVALIIDFMGPDLNVATDRTQLMLDACRDGRVRIDDVDLTSFVERLGSRSDVGAVELPGAKSHRGLPLERHQLILLRDLGRADRPSDEVVRRLLFGERLRFTDLLHPLALNQGEAYGAVTNGASLLCAHSEDIEYSVFLTTVQAVGTASRFQQIWQDAYHQVQEFQEHKQQKEAGVQQRRDLETLADHMGNLELDLAFSVQTAADLGLNPSTRIDSFHDDLYQVMQIRTRASTVGQMFDRLGGSIRSELTAIESRERQDEETRRHLDEERRRNGAFALSLITCVVAPITFLLGFFGMNVSEAHPGADMWDLGLFLPVYIIAGALTVAPVATFYLLQMLTRRRRREAMRGPTGLPGGGLVDQ
jgi:hypothetical protein